MTINEQVTKALEHAADSLACDLHNDAQTLIGNTAKSDVNWLAGRLFEMSTLGAADVRYRDWRMTVEEFSELKLQPQGLFSPERFDSMADEKRQPWIKLARIVLCCMPDIAERIGHRMEVQAKAVRAVWKELCSEIN